MPVDIENIFKAKARGTWDFLVENGQGCYIPPYQRVFSWGKENISRIFEDAVHGISMLPDRPESVTFLGTIIAIHDNNYTTVQPIYRSEVAPRVMTIIDGQQRLSSFLMINAALHHIIQVLSKKINKKDGPHAEWLLDEVERYLPDLEESFIIDMRTGDKNHRYYPRMIRSYDDVWSRKKGQARYESPVTALLWAYINHTKDENTSEFRFEPKDSSGEALSTHKTVIDAFKHIKSETKRIYEMRHKEISFPDLLEIARDNSVTEAIFGHAADESIAEFIREGSEKRGYDTYCKLLRVLILSKYINNRMAFTVVTVTSEDDAFDMFEALNTTGEPLTAYETFKPKIIEAEGMENFETSPSFEHAQKIESYLDNFTKAEAKQRATSEMLIPFALAETGAKLGKHLNEQRRYLRDEYAGQRSLGDKQAMTRRMSHLSEFMKVTWTPKDPMEVSFSPVRVSNPLSMLAIHVLRDMKHQITIAPLCRFYAAAVEAISTPSAPQKAEAYSDALLATFAFSMLWRGALGGTESIEQKYREIMQSGSKVDSVRPLCARPSDGAGAVSLTDYKKALRGFLDRKKILSRDNWVERASQVDIYDANREVARLLVIAASHDAVVDPSNPGLIKFGRNGVRPVMLSEIWLNTDYFTVEHVAPQSKRAEWKDDLYESSHTVHTLGNLILLPGEVNSVLGAKKWEHKKLVYSLLSAKDEEEYRRAESACEKVGLALGANAREILENTNYLPMCESLASFSAEWDRSFVEKRSRRIAELAFDKIRPLLEN